MIFAYSCINSLLMCDYFLCSHTRTHVYLFIVIFSYCNILEQLDLFTCVYPCLCQQTIVYSHHYFGWPNVLRALLCFGHPTTNIIFILLFVNYYIHVMLYSWWINLNWIELNWIELIWIRSSDVTFWVQWIVSQWN